MKPLLTGLHQDIASIQQMNGQPLMIREKQVEDEIIYQHLLEAAPDAILLVDQSGRIVLANRAAEKLFGYAREELLLQPFDRLISERFRRVHRRYVDRFLAAPYQRPMHTSTDMVGLHKDGRETPVEISLNPFESAGKSWIILMIRDITKRKEMAQSLERQEAYLRALIEHAPDVIVVLNTAGVIQYSSPSIERVLGYRPEDLRGRNVFELVHPDEVATTERLFTQRVRKEIPMMSHTLHVQHRDGPWRVLEVKGYNQLNNPAIQGIIVSAYDITQLVQAQEKAEQHAQKLQHILDASPAGMLILDQNRRVVLTNSLARQYLKLLAETGPTEILTHLGGLPIEKFLELPADAPHHKLEVKTTKHQVFTILPQPIWLSDSDDFYWLMVLRDVTEELELRQQFVSRERLAAVGQLAAGIAHDFNNILTGIIGYTELLQRRSGLPQSVQEDLSRIHQQGQRAADLIRQILDFSRQSILREATIELSTFLQDIIALLARTIPENIRIVLDIEPGNYTLKGDSTQLQQALTNLVLNARDAMPEGGVLTIQLSNLILKPGESPPHQKMKAGDWIVLSVHDTGCGIASDALPRVFEPFFTTKDVGQGHGLGLAQVYSIVTQHEGYITVDSREEEGTEFTIYLPIAAAGRNDPPTPPSNQVPVGNGELILLVEDEPIVLDTTREILLHLGYRVLTAKNGCEALDLYRQHRDEIAIVLTDATMPEMGARELAEALQQENSAVKIVVVTGYPLDAQSHDMLQYGIVEWVQKPVTIKRLAHTIHRALTGTLPD